MNVALEEEILTTEQVCQELHISKATLYRYRLMGKITPMNDNVYLDRPARLQFTRAEVERFKKARLDARKASQDT